MTSESPQESKPEGIDLDGDGKSSSWEVNLCRVCITAALVLTFGEKAILL